MQVFPCFYYDSLPWIKERWEGLFSPFDGSRAVTVVIGDRLRVFPEKSGEPLFSMPWEMVVDVV